MKGTHIQEASL